MKNKYSRAVSFLANRAVPIALCACAAITSPAFAQTTETTVDYSDLTTGASTEAISGVNGGLPKVALMFGIALALGFLIKLARRAFR